MTEPKRSREDAAAYRFLDEAFKRKPGWFYELIQKRGFTPSEFSRKAGIDFGNMKKIDNVAYRGSVSFWFKVWRALK